MMFNLFPFHSPKSEGPSNGGGRERTVRVIEPSKLKALGFLLITALGSLSSLELKADPVFMTSNGYSGLGAIPDAHVMPEGQVGFVSEFQIPGGNNPKGSNNVLGMGVFDSLEMSYRLADNNPHCNMVTNANCPNGQMRDLSASFKYRIPTQAMTFLGRQTQVAIGQADGLGGTSPFKSNYVVATHQSGPVQLTLGAAQAVGPNATLKGGFWGAQWNPSSWARVSMDHTDQSTWLHSTLLAHPLSDKTDLFITFNNQLTHNEVTQKSWLGLGVNVPLNTVRENNNPASNDAGAQSATRVKSKRFRLPHIKPFDFQDELIKSGFLKAKFGKRGNDLFLWVDQENFQWNAMDAAGLAMGLLAATFGDQAHEFQLVVGNRGLDVLTLSGNTACVKKWLEVGDPCSSTLVVQSAMNHTRDWSDVTWSFDSTDFARPELVLSPALVSILNTEYGAADFDLGLNVNPIMRVWKGGYVELNAVVPMGVRTHNFNEGGVFYPNRLTQQVSRQLFHQMVDLPKLNTQTMVSVGKIYQNYSGVALETQTFNASGNVRFGLQGGEFQSKDANGVDNKLNYKLGSLRYALDNRFNASTELTAGTFCAGDKGVKLSERIWHRDTSLDFYYKRSNLVDGSTISSVGFEIGFPLTPRSNSSFERLNLRGTSQFTYAVDTRVGSHFNTLQNTTNVIPDTGETLKQISNLDRNSDRYFEMRKDRLRQAYMDLRVEDRKSWVFD